MAAHLTNPSLDQPAVIVTERESGELLLSCPIEPAATASNMIDLLLERADEHPDRSLIVEQADDGTWHHLTYRQAVDGSRAVAQWLLDNDASPDRPLVILSPRSHHHFLMGWGAQMARVPYCPVSVAYSTVPGAFPKLHWVLETVRPAFVFAETLAAHQAGLHSVEPDSPAAQIVADATMITNDGGAGIVAFGELTGTEATTTVDDSIAAITPDTVTRYLFTSGSTGMPKGVIQTQLMHTSFLGAMSAISRHEPGSDFRVLDWMPWSHTGAGVMRLNMVIEAGGTVYLDQGRPVHGHFGKTVENLHVVKPTTYSGSPIGWAMLVEALEADDDLAAGFFANAVSFGFGAAAMPASLATRLQQLAQRHTGKPILLTTSLLSTEVAVGVNRWWPTEEHEIVGLPGPGADIKLVPLDDDRYEIRPRGAGITPGYLGDPAITAQAFDEEGFFRMGDAVRFFDPDQPELGLCFAGRVSEDFKLTTGTWVEAGTLRSLVVAAASPYVSDAVICGINEAEVAALIWPNAETCSELAGSDHPADSTAVRDAIATGLARHNDTNPASSTRIARFLLLHAGPDQASNEITEKGYINQRAVQDRRSDDVARLYSGSDPAVVEVPRINL